MATTKMNMPSSRGLLKNTCFFYLVVMFLQLTTAGATTTMVTMEMENSSGLEHYNNKILSLSLLRNRHNKFPAEQTRTRMRSLEDDTNEGKVSPFYNAWASQSYASSSSSSSLSKTVVTVTQKDLLVIFGLAMVVLAVVVARLLVKIRKARSEGLLPSTNSAVDGEQYELVHAGGIGGSAAAGQQYQSPNFDDDDDDDDDEDGGDGENVVVT